MRVAVTIDDLRAAARRRLPKVIFDYIDGGVEDELALVANRVAFERYAFVPRYLRDVSRRTTTTTLLGTRYALPFGIAPTGFAGLFRPGADLMLAKAAEAANIPFVLSGASNASVESITAAVARHTWFQIYCTASAEINADLLARAGNAGVTTIVLTIDVPVTPKRVRNLRNGFGLPPQVRAGTLLDALMHPAWTLGYLAHRGLPRLGNWVPYGRSGASALDIARLFAAQTPDPSHTWEQLAYLRAIWPGALLVKGVMHPDDARRAVELGADGIWVSNHGGRQLDRVPSSLAMLPAIRVAIGANVPVLLDSGVRRGADIAAALCLGADFVFAGRPTLFGAVAAGQAGAERAIAILAEELDLVMGQIGCAEIGSLCPDYLHQPQQFIQSAEASADASGSL